MFKSKLLIDTSWKEVLSKNKALKDNGLLKSLGEIKKLGEDDHDDAQKLLDEIVKLSGQLKKNKDAAGNPAVSKFLAELSSAADTAQKDVAKSKAEAAKKDKSDADAKKREEAKGGEDGEEEEEVSDLLTTKMIPLLRELNKGDRTMHVLVASAGKQVAVMISRKPISPARRKLLAEELGVSSGIKYIMGHCLKEEGMTTFALKTQVAGMAKRLKVALLQQTGLRVKVRCRGEDGETDEDFEEHDHQAKSGGDDDDDEGGRGEGDSDGAKARKRTVAASGDDDAGEEGDQGDEDAADGGKDEVEEAPKAPKSRIELKSTPKLWLGTRDLLGTNIESVRKAVQDKLGDEEGDYVDEVNANLEKLDRILEKLDKRLTSTLTAAAEADDPDVRKATLKEAKGIIAEYLRYVGSEPLIEHLDNNPFGVKTNLKSTLSASLGAVARALA